MRGRLVVSAIAAGAAAMALAGCVVSGVSVKLTFREGAITPSYPASPDGPRQVPPDSCVRFGMVCP